MYLGFYRSTLIIFGWMINRYKEIEINRTFFINFFNCFDLCFEIFLFQKLHWQKNFPRYNVINLSTSKYLRDNKYTYHITNLIHCVKYIFGFLRLDQLKKKIIIQTTILYFMMDVLLIFVLIYIYQSFMFLKRITLAFKTY